MIDLKLRARLHLNCTTLSPVTNKLCRQQNARNSGLKIEYNRYCTVFFHYKAF